MDQQAILYNFVWFDWAAVPSLLTQWAHLRLLQPYFVVVFAHTSWISASLLAFRSVSLTVCLLSLVYMYLCVSFLSLSQLSLLVPTDLPGT